VQETRKLMQVLESVKENLKLEKVESANVALENEVTYLQDLHLQLKAVLQKLQTTLEKKDKMLQDARQDHESHMNQAAKVADKLKSELLQQFTVKDLQADRESVRELQEQINELKDKNSEMTKELNQARQMLQSLQGEQKHEMSGSRQILESTTDQLDHALKDLREMSAQCPCLCRQGQVFCCSQLRQGAFRETLRFLVFQTHFTCALLDCPRDQSFYYSQTRFRVFPTSC
jgi:chromosome segregation ATPase